MDARGEQDAKQGQSPAEARAGSDLANRGKTMPAVTEAVLTKLEHQCADLAVIARDGNLRYVAYLLEIAAQEVAAKRAHANRSATAPPGGAPA